MKKTILFMTAACLMALTACGNVDSKTPAKAESKTDLDGVTLTLRLRTGVIKPRCCRAG
ncbi:hypothetical protein [uncultured Ruminococcus sp.]|uniref:hypothetical protein n=1 Tax=uncultured Ruminococcus sp. TaxID=165186 RepID=UPI0025D5D188|nr:hypothetical protein [uncultured Ruminococcus sp.]